MATCLPCIPRQMRTLLTVTAVIEAATGLALIAMPAIVVRLLVGAPLQTYSGVVLGRIAGAALFALGVACWFARYDAKISAARWFVGAMFIYNLCATVILGVAGICVAADRHRLRGRRWFFTRP